MFYDGMPWREATSKLNQMWNFFEQQEQRENDLRNKYPALKDAWEKYEMLKILITDYNEGK